MAFLDEKVKEEVKKGFEGLKNEVKIINFTQELECMYCKETQSLLEEVSELSDKIKLDVKNFINDKEEAAEYGVDKTPATIILSDKDHGIKFYGIPTGYEFSTLLESIKMVSGQELDLPEDVSEQIKKIDKPVHLQVFVTPTCPHCPRAVVTSHVLAFLNDNIKAEMVESSEFPQLASKYGVRGVPQIVINEKPTQPGALPLNMLLEEIDKVLV